MLPRFNGWPNRWQSSDFTPLPPAGAREDAATADYRVLFEGLAELLGRCSPRGAERHFPAALKGFKGLRQQWKHRCRPELPAQVLSDLCHEIAEHADHATREAAVRCLRRRALECPAPPAASPGAECDSTAFEVDAWEEARTVQAPARPYR
ncbi:MAG: hypothetical protein ACO1PB_01465 [Ramlibacter sp.]